MNKKLTVRLDDKTYKALKKKLVDLEQSFQEFFETKAKEEVKTTK